LRPLKKEKMSRAICTKKKRRIITSPPDPLSARRERGFLT
jgi:hypothetical protein